MTGMDEQVSEIIAMFQLAPHPEGGWFRRVYTSDTSIKLGGRMRPATTSILYLLGGFEESRWHRLSVSEELWMWRAGGPMTIELGGTGSEPEIAHRITIGASELDVQPVLIPKNTWQCARPQLATWSLVSCVVTPGFDFDDFHFHDQGPPDA